MWPARPRIDGPAISSRGELLPLLGQTFDTRGARVRRIAPRRRAILDFGALDRRSDISGALAAAAERYRGRPVPGIVLLSDGGDTDERSVDRAGGVDASVFAHRPRVETIASDREMLSATAADAALDDSRVDLAVAAVSHGHGTEPMALRLLENGRPLEVRRRDPGGGRRAGSRASSRSRRARGAATVYTVETAGAGGELVPENNSRSVLVQPPSRVRRVLFVEGAPGFEHSFLKRAWAADPGLEVDSIVRKGKNEQGSRHVLHPGVAVAQRRAHERVPAARSRTCSPTTRWCWRTSRRRSSRERSSTRHATSWPGAAAGCSSSGARSFGKPGLADTPIDDVLPLQLSDAADAVRAGLVARAA